MTAQYSQGTFVSNGLVTHYLDAGSADAPLLVLLHEGAFGATAEASWGALIPILAEKYRVIAPDMYGYGASSKVVQFDAPPWVMRLHQVAGLLDSLGLSNRRAHLIGNSLGGAIALRAATLDWFAGRLNSVVSFGGTGGAYRTEEGLAQLARFDGTASDMARLVRFANGDFDGLDDHVAARMAGASAGNYRSIMAPALDAPLQVPPPADSYPESLADTAIPIVTIGGSDDPFVEPQWAQEISRHAPLGRALTIAGGHNPNVVDPVGTARLILEVLAENERLLAEREGTTEGREWP